MPSRFHFHAEAVRCRILALLYLGAPEGVLLLRVAREFDRLAAEKNASQRVS